MTNMETEHKSNIFCLICRDRKNLLSIYNAVNGSDYSDESKLQVVTLENAILLRMHNDAAFIIDQHLHLYEHQSTVNPNIPLRDLYYVVEEYKKMVPMKKLYGRWKMRIPAPQFITFYNGREEQPEEREFKLSDLFETPEEEPSLELIVRQININKGYSEKILERCEILKEYMLFVEKVRCQMDEGVNVEKAVTDAVNECIREGILEDFLQEHKSEVISMGIFDFNEEEWEEVIRGESYLEGKAEGKVEGKAEGKAEAITSLLELLGDVTEDLKNRIYSEKDLETLKEWLIMAAKSKTLEEFVQEIEK